MTSKFNTKWKRSSSATKQHKYHYNAPLHVKQKMVRAHLSQELRKKYGVRSFGVKKGDKVKVLEGQFSKKEGKVNRVILRRERIYVDGIEMIKKDGTKVPYPLHASKVLLLELNLNDKRRKEKLNPPPKSNTNPPSNSK